MKIAFFPLSSDDSIDIWEDVTVAIPHAGDSVMLGETSFLVEHLHWVNKDYVEAYVSCEVDD